MIKLVEFISMQDQDQDRDNLNACRLGTTKSN